MRFARNKIIFQNDVVPYFKVVALIKAFNRNWSLTKVADCVVSKFCSMCGANNNISKGKIRKEVWWNKPTQGCYKINFDGSKLQDGSASYSFIIRDWKGTLW